jgi:hypothetical protein
MKLHASLLFLAAATTGTLSACSPYPRTEASFGDSVRHMISSQTVTNGPVDPSPVEEGDGQRINGVLEGLRNDVSRDEQGPAPVAITFGSGMPQR